MNKANENIAREIVAYNKYKIEAVGDKYIISLEWQGKKYEEIIPMSLAMDMGTMDKMNSDFAQGFAIHLITKAIDNIGKKMDEADAERYKKEAEEIFKNRGDGESYDDDEK